MQISAAGGGKVIESFVLVWKVLLQHIQRTEPCLDLGPTPRPTLPSDKDVL